MSLEEEKARQEKSSPTKPSAQIMEMSEEDRELQQALQMSLATHDEENKDVEMQQDDDVYLLIRNYWLLSASYLALTKTIQD